VSDGATVEVSRVLPAPAAQVFRWWTEAELLRRWMSPAGSVHAEVDLRVGGSFRIVMKGAEIEIDHTGEYLEIDRPHRLVFSWRSEYAGDSSLVTVTFHPEGPNATRLVIVHSGLPQPVATDHRSGWGAMADRLAAEMLPT
jgi:uncharacterized protein YndB with AHSA1/START domain